MDMNRSSVPIIALLFVLLLLHSRVFADGNNLTLPIFLEIHKHEKELFDWHPKFTLNVPSFDSANVPYIRSRTSDLDATAFVHTLQTSTEDAPEISKADFDGDGTISFADFIDFASAFGSAQVEYDIDGSGLVDFSDFLAFVTVFGKSKQEWVKLDFHDELRTAYPTFAKTVFAAGWYGSRIVFDADDHAYTIIRIKLRDESEKNVLLYSRDHCKTWQIYELPDADRFHIEHSGTPSSIPETPAILLLSKRADHQATWASYYIMHLIVPRKTKGGLSLEEKIAVTNACFGFSQHSGGAAFVATRAGKTHIVWGEATEGIPPNMPSLPEYWPDVVLSPLQIGKLPGTPTYIATYDRNTGTLGAPMFIAYAPPVNDAHNAPGICIDSEGYLHVITGAHHSNFFYSKSLQPNNAYGGWTEPQPALTTGYWGTRTIFPIPEKQWGRQTYLSFVCDQKNTLHIVFRHLQTGYYNHHHNNYYMALAYQRKTANGPWEDAVQLIFPPIPRYSIYYHKLAIDRAGNLYLSYNYYSTQELYESYQERYRYTSMLFSNDSGNTWSLARTLHFGKGIRN